MISGSGKSKAEAWMCRSPHPASHLLIQNLSRPRLSLERPHSFPLLVFLWLILPKTLLEAYPVTPGHLITPSFAPSPYISPKPVLKHGSPQQISSMLSLPCPCPRTVRSYNICKDGSNNYNSSEQSLRACSEPSITPSTLHR